MSSSIFFRLKEPKQSDLRSVPPELLLFDLFFDFACLEKLLDGGKNGLFSRSYLFLMESDRIVFFFLRLLRASKKVFLFPNMLISSFEGI